MSHLISSRKGLCNNDVDYFPNDPCNRIIISIEKVINSNIRRDPKAIMVENFSLTIST